MRRSIVALACALAAPSAFAAKAPKAAAKPMPAPVRVASVEGITDYQLGNGLHVLLYPDQSKPEMTVNITYIVGSRNESYGETGMAHLLEHLLFKGTDQHPDVPKVLNGYGARFNGSTWFDRTNYFSSFPASDANLKIALELEADRMVNSHIWKSDLWNEKEKRGEMSVVRNEMESGENNPIEVTNERIASVAFDWHNYGKSTIGARSDVENVNIEHLKAFYQRYYQPDNAYLLIAGKIDEAKVLAQVNAMFGAIPRPARTLEKTWTVEPVQDGERSVTVRRVGGTPYLGIAYHVPQSANPEADAIDIAAQLLDSAPSGRLYKALVETRLASQVNEETVTTLEPGLLQFDIQLPKEGDVAAAQAAALGVLEHLKDHPITQVELDRAKAEQARLYDQMAQHTDRLATSLSESMAAGDWRLYYLGRDNIQALTLLQVQAAAEKYFRSSNRTIGSYVPTDKPERAEMPAPLDVQALVKDYKGHAAVAEGEQFDPTPKNIEERALRFGDPAGVRVALLPKRTKGGSLSLQLTFHFGSEQALMNRGAVPGLTGGMLLRGTTKHTREQLKDAFDQLKTQVNISGTADSLRVVLASDKDHYAAALDLIAEVLKTPSFPADELATLRAAELTDLEQNKSEPQAIAFIAAQHAIDPYPKGHPLAAESMDDQIADLKAAQLEELKAFHREFYGAEHGEIAAVGDFDAKALQAQLSALFGNWRSKQPYARVIQRAGLSKPSSQRLETPDKANAFFVALNPIAMKDSDADYNALSIANRILGGGALKSRLADRIRQKEGLSYGIGSFFQAGALDPVSVWGAYAIYAPQNVERLDAAFREELARAAKEGFTAEELSFAKSSWKQGQDVSRTQDNELARRLSTNLQALRTMAFDQATEDAVAQLTLEQVNAAMRKYIDVGRLTIFEAGDFKKITASK
jgi:zinc protease